MASGKFILISLCSVLLLSQLIVPAHSWSCCLSYTKRQLPCKRLLAYSLQTINQNCDINAVIFHMTNGRFVCADPLSSQTRRGMQCVDQRQQQEAKIMA
ncbi:C-C motif chemokine 20b [Periophthalmus magnuspinnatus]|uniref:C-C motif chemokine 20b n=1 Tax=Periophthalmus magnuspinnatus TaxID=409849 RepID=UPI00145AE416|nr:C-C motif chemokine 20b [Periophthalmus magnuspinnatus]